MAVLSVVIFHAFPSHFKGGFIGVDIFFVISGFLITRIILSNLDNGDFSFSQFYARRIRRIFPSLLIVLVVSFALGWFALLADEYRQVGLHITAGVGFVSNFVLLGEAGYFDNSGETKPLLHLWSLGVEEQFYIFWPLLLWIAWRRKINLLTVGVVAAAFSFYLNLKGIKQNAVAAFYLPQSRFWELLCGSILAWVDLWRNNRYLNIYIKPYLDRVYLKDVELRLNYLSNLLSLVGVIVLSYGFLTISKFMIFPGWLAVLPVLGTSLIIISGPRAWINNNILNNRFLVWIGVLSFPLYLWHWPLLTFARIIGGEQQSTYVTISVLLVSVVLAWLTYYFVEARVRILTGGLRSKSVLVLLLLSAFMGIAGYSVWKNDGFSQRAHIQLYEAANAQFTGALWPYTSNDTCLKEFKYKDVKELPYWFCMKSDRRPATIALIGNSFANQLYPGFVSNALLTHHTILSIGTCDFSGMDGNPDPSGPCFGKKQADQNEFIDELVKNNLSIRYVIIDGLSRTPDSAYIESTLKRIAKLKSFGVKVIIFMPHLYAGYHPKRCISRPLRKADDCSFSQTSRAEIRQNFLPLELELLKDKNIMLFEQNDIFCYDDPCSYLLSGLPLLRDETHLSEFASVQIQKFFTIWLTNNLPEMFGIVVPR